MRSRANIQGHPLHPILVSFPIAFFVGALVLDIIVLMTGDIFFGKMATVLNIGGVIFAILAAIPGIIDYFTIVPPKSSAKKRAARHGLLNISMLIIFIILCLLRKDNGISLYMILLLEVVGVVVLTIAGWLGGTLVHRNQIGIDHRYANAGKWKEETIRSQKKIELKDLDKLGVNQMKLLHVNHRRIVIGRTESGLVAFSDSCTHRGGTLADGVMICSVVQCPWHGSQFDVNTGKVKAGPAKESIRTYKIQIADQKYYLQF